MTEKSGIRKPVRNGDTLILIRMIRYLSGLRMADIMRKISEISPFHLIISAIALLVVLSVVFVIVHQYSEPSFSPAPGSLPRDLIAVGDENALPFSFMADGKPVGYDIDLITAIGEKSGLNITIRLMRWTDALNAVTTGKADILIGVSQTEEREKILDFSEHTLSQHSALFINREQFQNPITEASTFSGTISVRAGGSNAELVRIEFPHATMVEFPSQEEALHALVAGDVDIFAGNYYVGLYYAQRDNLEDKIKIIGTPFEERLYGPAVRKGNRDLQHVLTQAIRNLEREGTIQRIQDTWFGQDYFPNLYLKYLSYLFIAALACLLLVVSYTLVLRRFNRKVYREVEIRTQELNQSGEVIHTQYAIIQGILNSTENGIFSIDRDFRYTAFNAAHARIMKEQHDIAIQHGINLETLLSDHERETIKKNIERALHGERFSEVEYSPGIGLSSHYYLVMYNPILNMDESVIGVALFTTDITDYKAMEEKNHEAVIRMNKIMETLSILNDQIRNPLTVMLMLADNLNEPEKEHYLREIQNINDLVTQLDKGWVESEKIRAYLIRHHGMEFS